MATVEPGHRAGAALIEWLDAQGERKRANDLRSIMRSLASARTTCSVLHRDNVALRNEVEAAMRSWLPGDLEGMER